VNPTPAETRNRTTMPRDPKIMERGQCETRDATSTGSNENDMHAERGEINDDIQDGTVREDTDYRAKRESEG